MTTKSLTSKRQDCRDANHPISWHWSDGRPRTTCGFCGDPLDHANCPTCKTAAKQRAKANKNRAAQV